MQIESIHNSLGRNGDLKSWRSLCTFAGTRKPEVKLRRMSEPDSEGSVHLYEIASNRGADSRGTEKSVQDIGSSLWRGWTRRRRMKGQEAPAAVPVGSGEYLYLGKREGLRARGSRVGKGFRRL